MRDGKIDAIEAGQWRACGWPTAGPADRQAMECDWVRLLREEGQACWGHEQLAIPVAADRETDRKVAMSLVNDTGLDAYDAGAT